MIWVNIRQTDTPQGSARSTPKPMIRCVNTSMTQWLRRRIDSQRNRSTLHRPVLHMPDKTQPGRTIGSCIGSIVIREHPANDVFVDIDAVRRYARRWRSADKRWPRPTARAEALVQEIANSLWTGENRANVRASNAIMYYALLSSISSQNYHATSSDNSANCLTVVFTNLPASSRDAPLAMTSLISCWMDRVPSRLVSSHRCC